MEILRAFLYSLALFGGLVVLALLVAGIMKIIYVIVHRSEKKAGSGTEVSQPAAQDSGKVG